MPKYDGLKYDPPAPIAEVLLRNIESGAIQSRIFLQIDTGADMTLLPKAAVQQLGIKPLDGIDYELQAFDGSKSIAEVVELDLIFLKKAYRGRYLLIDTEHGILGRDVLANIALLLVGPHQEWSQQAG